MDHPHLLLLRIWALALDEGALWQLHTDLASCARDAYSWWDKLKASGDESLDQAAWDYACWATETENQEKRLTVTRLFLRAVSRYLREQQDAADLRGAP